MNTLTIKVGDILTIKNGMIFVNYVYAGTITSIGIITTLAGDLK